jgi:hypothetical protein
MTWIELLSIYYPVLTLFLSALVIFAAAVNESAVLAICGVVIFFVGLFQTMTLLSTGGVDWS